MTQPTGQGSTPVYQTLADQASAEAQQRANAEPTGGPVPQGTANRDDIQAMIDQALQREREQHSAETETLRSELASMRAANAGPSDTIPWNSAGIGTDKEASWGQYDQDLANRGDHPLQEKETAS